MQNALHMYICTWIGDLILNYSILYIIIGTHIYIFLLFTY